MSRTVIPSPAAARDIAAVRKWLAQPGSGVRAAAKWKLVRQSIRNLKDSPCRWPEGDHQGVRELPVAGYRVMYEIDPDTDDNETAGDVRLVRVFGPGQSRDEI